MGQISRGWFKVSINIVGAWNIIIYLPCYQLHIDPAPFLRNYSKCQQQQKTAIFLNHTINAFPIECIPGQFCGPDSHLEKRLARGINPLDGVSRHSLFEEQRFHKTTYSWQNTHWSGTEMNYRKRFDSWRESCCHNCLGSYESQNENWYRFENEEEKTDE